MTRKGWLTIGLAFALGAVLGYIDINSQEVQLPMICLLLFSFVLGAFQPRAAWRWGLLIGLSIPTAYLVAYAANFRVADAPGDHITLVVLVIPALIAAYAGALAGQLSQGQDARVG